AIAILLALEAYAHTGTDGSGLAGVIKVLVGIPVLAGVAYGFGRWVLSRLFMRFDTIREYVFLVTIGWCMGMAELAGVLGLSHEIGAFLAGITLASSPISQYIAENLKPLRDFFLVIFFFSLGAGFDLGVLGEIWLPATVLAAIVLVAKPLIFRQLFLREGERPRHSLEMGVRLGQVSEFALLVAILALHGGVIGERASYFIQTVTLLTFIASSYYIVMRYPTPIAVTDKLRRD
ncbi:MAG: cation:proton antiporter, partial [Gammaproteobacteria bacterium]